MATCIALSIFTVACNAPTNDAATKAAETVVAQPDMAKIKAEIKAIEDAVADKKDNPLKNAPHTQLEVISSNWPHSYSRETAAFPLPWVISHKFWPTVARINNTHGDRNLVCTCEPTESYA